MFESIKKLKLKPEYVIIAILLITVILLYIKTAKSNVSGELSTESYILQTEQKLKKSLEKIDGVKKATVTITVKEGIKTIIAEDVKITDDGGKKTSTSSPVFVNGKPIILGEVYPEIAGVVVICNCSDSMAVRMSVLDVVTMMLDVPCDKVRIIIQ